jgi:hypothetical protein
MILLGCTDGGIQCAPISTLPVAYQSEALCLAARADMVAATTGLGYGRVIADCRRQDSVSPRRLVAKASTSA